ncbi:MAG: bactofilin family protein [Nitrospiraceae bacterium]
MWPIGDKNTQAGSDNENFTFLGKDVVFKGVVNFNGTIRIDGRVEGEIHTTGTLIVGEYAVIKGIISAGIVLTSGKINGTVTATEKIQLLKPGVLIGDIRTPAILIEEGSHFHGMCDMGTHKWEEENQSPDKNVRDLSAHRGKRRSSDL